MADSCSTARSAASPSSRHHSAMAFRVLNRKCGSRWERSASSWARSASRASVGRPRLGARQAALEPDVPPQAPAADQEQRQADQHAGRRGQQRPAHVEHPGHHDADGQHHPGADGAVERAAGCRRGAGRCARGNSTRQDTGATTTNSSAHDARPAAPPADRGCSCPAPPPAGPRPAGSESAAAAPAAPAGLLRMIEGSAAAIDRHRRSGSSADARVPSRLPTRLIQTRAQQDRQVAHDRSGRQRIRCPARRSSAAPRARQTCASPVNPGGTWNRRASGACSASQALDVLRRQRPRADQAHVAAQNVEQLRQLVQAALAHPAHNRVGRRAADRPRWSGCAASRSRTAAGGGPGESDRRTAAGRGRPGPASASTATARANSGSSGSSSDRSKTRFRFIGHLQQCGRRALIDVRARRPRRDRASGRSGAARRRTVGSAATAVGPWWRRTAGLPTSGWRPLARRSRPLAPVHRRPHPQHVVSGGWRLR